MRKNTKQHIFPAGEYYIGDPCYFVKDEDDNWEKLLERTGYFGLPNHAHTDWNDGLYHYKDLPCFAHETMWGDGCYDLRDYSEKNWLADVPILAGLGVDAGLLGIMPAEAIDCKNDLVYRAVFDYDFPVFATIDGTFYFGHLVVYTK